MRSGQSINGWMVWWMDGQMEGWMDELIVEMKNGRVAWWIIDGLTDW